MKFADFDNVKQNLYLLLRGQELMRTQADELKELISQRAAFGELKITIDSVEDYWGATWR